MWHLPHHSYFTLTTAALSSRDYLAINVSALLDQDFWRWKGQPITLLLLEQSYSNGSTTKRSTGMSHRLSRTSFYNTVRVSYLPVKMGQHNRQRNFRAIFGHTLNLPCYAHLSAAAFRVYISSNAIRLVNEGAILEVSAEIFDKTSTFARRAR